MAKTVTEEYAELYHYTTAEGLHGIIASQYLHATNIAFLNDAEERTHYLDRRMPLVLEQVVRSRIDELIKNPKCLAQIKQNGGYEKVVMDSLSGVITGIRKTTLLFDEPYIASFCGAKDEKVAKHGLLSQWRAYGADGGYAIVFDTTGLEALLKEEFEKFLYLSLKWGDVNYYDGDGLSPMMLEEHQESEDALKDGIARFLEALETETLEPIYDAISSLSCLTKHWGFYEEKEVRIVATRGTKAFIEESRKLGDIRPDRQVHHFSRGGIVVPYIRLFEGITELPDRKLPIKAVIVGPHPDKMRRKKAVEILLEQRGISAEVMVSEIPYLSR